MEKKKGTLRTCSKGHAYYKSSDCRTCPICEAERKPAGGFMADLSAPARRALEAVGATTLKKLSSFTKEEVLELHGIGPTAIPKLMKALEAEGLSFSQRK